MYTGSQVPWFGSLEKQEATTRLLHLLSAVDSGPLKQLMSESCASWLRPRDGVSKREVVKEVRRLHAEHRRLLLKTNAESSSIGLILGLARKRTIKLFLRNPFFPGSGERVLEELVRVDLELGWAPGDAH